MPFDIDLNDMESVEAGGRPLCEEAKHHLADYSRR